MLRKLSVFALIVASFLLITPSSVFAQTQTCLVIEPSIEEVAPGVTLTYDSAFLCEEAPTIGDYQFTVNITNDSTETVEINDLQLALLTPSPRGQSPTATATATGLPLTLLPGEGGSFDVSGSYEMVQTGEGDKVNLHLRATGLATTSEEVFILGINAQLRSTLEDESEEEEEEEEEEGEGEGPPSWVPGPPPWAPGPPPWAGGRP